MRKVFISFLGTGNYSECEYVFNNASVKTKFIQEALLELFCKEFSGEDAVFLFLTEDAKNKTWENGLKDKIKDIGLLPEIITRDIPVGKSEDEIWEIFNAVYEVLKDNDSVILDITHGFRSLPMLALVILNYARYMKNIIVKDIYYGAWEARDTSTNKAPIFQLTQFYNLMQWTSAADTFVNYGISDKLQDIVWETANILDGTKPVAKAISRITESMSTLRGSDIVEGEIFVSCIAKIDELNSSGKAQAAFKPIISKVKEKIEVFREKDSMNFIYAVKWYIDHKMIPQALTMMQEGLLTWFMEKRKIDYHNRVHREYVAAYLQKIVAIKIDPDVKFNFCEDLTKMYEEWGFKADDNFFSRTAYIYGNVSNLRNDVNHGGFNIGATPYNSIIQNVKKNYDKLEALCQEFSAS